MYFLHYSWAWIIYQLFLADDNFIPLSLLKTIDAPWGLRLLCTNVCHHFQGFGIRIFIVLKCIKIKFILILLLVKTAGILCPLLQENLQSSLFAVNRSTMPGLEPKESTLTSNLISKVGHQFSKLPIRLSFVTFFPLPWIRVCVMLGRLIGLSE